MRHARNLRKHSPDREHQTQQGCTEAKTGTGVRVNPNCNWKHSSEGNQLALSTRAHALKHALCKDPKRKTEARLRREHACTFLPTAGWKHTDTITDLRHLLGTNSHAQARNLREPPLPSLEHCTNSERPEFTKTQACDAF